jgi:SET domain-containing protein
MLASPLPAFVVRRSPIQGRGVFAARDIAPGERIIEYTGDRISSARADAMSPDDGASPRHHTFLFAVDEKIVIDGGSNGNAARFINHSCSPNCEAVVSRRRVFIVASRRIRQHRELSYDYWYDTDASYGLDELRRLYPCRCGSRRCRGTLARPPRRAAGAGAGAERAR